MCPNCHAFHGVAPLEHLVKGGPRHFIPDWPCIQCGMPVSALSMGGPGICAACDAGLRFPKFEPLEEPLDELTTFIKEVDTGD